VEKTREMKKAMEKGYEWKYWNLFFEDNLMYGTGASERKKGETCSGVLRKKGRKGCTGKSLEEGGRKQIRGPQRLLDEDLEHWDVIDL